MVSSLADAPDHLHIHLHNHARKSRLLPLQIDQTPSLRLTLLLLRSKGIVIRLSEWTAPEPIHACRPCLSRCHAKSTLSLLLRSSSELLVVEERIIASLTRMQLIETLARAVDEGTGGRVLGRYPELTGVTKGVHAFTRSQESIQALVLWVHCFLWGSGLLRSLVTGDWVIGRLVCVEVSGRLLLRKGTQRRWHAVLLLHLWPILREGVVRTSRCRLERIVIWLLVCGPRVLATSRGRTDLLWLLLLRLKLIVEAVLLLRVGVVQVIEGSLLGLDVLLGLHVIRLLLLKFGLVEASLLRLEVVLESRLLGLEASGLRICVVEVTS